MLHLCRVTCAAVNHRLAVAASAAALTALLSACGDDSGSASETTTTQPATTSPSTTAAGSAGSTTTANGATTTSVAGTRLKNGTAKLQLSNAVSAKGLPLHLRARLHLRLREGRVPPLAGGRRLRRRRPEGLRGLHRHPGHRPLRLREGRCRRRQGDLHGEPLTARSTCGP